MRYYLIAGEASGDLHGSNLIKGLAVRDPESEFRYWGGDRMDEAAASRPHRLVRHYKDGAVMGAVEVLAKAGRLLGNLKFCKKDILAWRPDVVIFIDYPGFNMKIAGFCHKRGIRTFYYIAPKTWASREGRNRQIKDLIDRLFIVFPFEKEYFTSKGIDYIYEGNPLIDAVGGHRAPRECREKRIAILAGSRKTEISRMMPVCMEMADKLKATGLYDGYRFIVAGAPARDASDYERYIQGRKDVELVFGKTYEILEHADAAVINSGTASLEAALIGTPQVVGWSTSPVTYFIGKNIFRVLDHIKYISLGNLCIDRPAFRELLQDELNSDALAAEIRRLIEDRTYRERMLDDYEAIRKSLGGSGASERIAAHMVSILSGTEN